MRDRERKEREMDWKKGSEIGREEEIKKETEGPAGLLQEEEKEVRFGGMSQTETRVMATLGNYRAQ